MKKFLKYYEFKDFYNHNKDKINLLLKILLVGIYSLYEWLLGYRFFAISIFIFFIIALVCKGKGYFVLIISIISIFFIFNTFTLDALVVMRNEESAFIQHPKEDLENLLTPGTGLFVLPEPVQVIISLIKVNEIDNYQLSPELFNNEEIRRRVIESAWPIKMEDKSSFVFITPNEKASYENCIIVDQKEDITLVDCP